MKQMRLKGITVLVAEDDLDLRECISENLMIHGAEVLSAENGKVALELFTKQPVDIVLSDFRMPGGDGLSLLKALRAKDPVHPPFVFLSGYSDLSSDDAIKEGAQAFFHKPCDLNQVADNLLSLIKK